MATSEKNAAKKARDEAQLLRDREFHDRQRAGAMALQRSAWRRGQRGGLAQYVDVDAPDGTAVRVQVRWAGGLSADQPTDVKSGSRGWDTTSDQTGVLPLIELAIGLGLGFVLAIRWLSIEIRRAPRWIVTAAVPVDGPIKIVARTRHAHAAARAAGELADEIERGGSLSTPGAPGL